VKVRQIMLVQVVKEERGNKGAALTTYLSLAGRYCVLMPNTARGGGISRKITSATDRKKLKDIAGELEVPQGAGLIIRTAGAKRTRTEIKRDYEYLMRQWEQIREFTLGSIAPTLIYEEGSLIKRSIRDLYGRDIDEITVEGIEGYREAKDYMKMLMPSHARNVRQYAEPLPLFSRYQVENTLAAMFNPTVQLKSGGYIVIGVTEALVAIDVNSGKSTREGSIEETALKTNLEAAEEVARQLRLRDLAGLIVIDFIDMDERKNNSAVEKMLKDKLKADRARIQIGRISTFGLLEMSRQRLRTGMIEASTAPCPHCHGTGIVRSDESLALSILRALEEEGTKKRAAEIALTVPVSVANYLFNQKRAHIEQIEARFALSIRIEVDATLISPDYRLERLKTPTRIVNHDPAKGAIQVDSLSPEEIAEEEAAAAAEAEALRNEEAGEEDDGTTKKKRRRSRSRKKSYSYASESGEGAPANGLEVVEAAAEPAADTAIVDVPESDVQRPSRPRPAPSTDTKAESAEAPAPGAAPAETEEPKGPAVEPATEPVAAEAPVEPAPEPVAVDAPAEPEPAAEPAPEPEPEVAAEPAPAPAPEPEDTGPKKRGWWSRALGS
ncbi:MAG: ribonuclease E/G, partial [Pseudomonadota bacterium]